jgi:hypothetical protein
MDITITKELISYHKNLMEGTIREIENVWNGQGDLRMEYRTHERFVEELERQLKNG